MPDHETIYQKELWKLFEQKARAEYGDAFVTAVEKVCGAALALANDTEESGRLHSMESQRIEYN